MANFKMLNNLCKQLLHAEIFYLLIARCFMLHICESLLEIDFGGRLKIQVCFFQAM